MSREVSWLVPGIATAPIRIAPSIAAYQAGTRGSMMNTGSPGFTPEVQQSPRGLPCLRRARSAAVCSATSLAPAVERHERELVGRLVGPALDDVDHGVVGIRELGPVARPLVLVRGEAGRS